MISAALDILFSPAGLALVIGAAAATATRWRPGLAARLRKALARLSGATARALFAQGSIGHRLVGRLLFGDDYHGGKVGPRPGLEERLLEDASCAGRARRLFWAAEAFFAGLPAENLRVKSVRGGGAFELERREEEAGAGGSGGGSRRRAIRVTLLGVNAPPPEKTHAAARAVEASREILEGRKVRLEFDPASWARGHRNRRSGLAEAYVWVRQRSGEGEARPAWILLNRELITHGFAEASTLPHPRRKAFLKAQRKLRAEAESRGVGRFSRGEEQPENWPYRASAPCRKASERLSEEVFEPGASA